MLKKKEEEKENTGEITPSGIVHVVVGDTGLEPVTSAV